MRASGPEYDAWNEFGSGWDWRSLLPCFKAQERYEACQWGTDQIFPGITQEEDEAARQKEPEFRGHSGAVHSTHNTLYSDLLKPMIETTLACGIKTNRTPVCNLSVMLWDYRTDVNVQGYGDSTGMFNVDTAVNRKDGTRSYATNAYLHNPESIVPQANLVVLKDTYATKMLFDSNHSALGAKAVGLACLGGVDRKSTAPSSFPFELRVKKDIIVSAGKLGNALNTQLPDLINLIYRFLQHSSTSRAQWYW